MKNIVVLYYDKKNNVKINDFEQPIEGYANFEIFEERLNHLKDKYDFFMINDHNEGLDYFYQNREKIDLVLNFADNGFENDFSKNAFFIDLFNHLGIKYTGRQANNVEFFERKDLMLYVLDYLGIKYPNTVIYYPGLKIGFLEEKVNSLTVPIIVKMGMSGDSLMLDQNSICYSFSEVVNRIEHIEKELGAKNTVLIQEFVKNAREYTTLVIGNHECNDVQAYTIKVTPIKFYDFEQKNYSDAPVEEYYHRCDLENIKIKTIEDKLIYVKKITDCKDYIRFDWLLDQDDNFYLLDLNANPSFDSSVFRLYNEFYSPDGTIIEHIIKSALKR